MDFLQNQILIFTSRKYENIYIQFKEKYDLPYHRFFMMCAALGAKMGRKSIVSERGREFRSNYLSSDERYLAYSIILNDELKGKDIDQFNDKEFYAEARKLLEQYAEGGMDILVEQVFKSKWNGQILDEKYDNYQIDILSYVATALKEVPF